jgi:hypothetical protein
MRLTSEIYCDEGASAGAAAASAIDIWARVSQYERKPKLATIRDLTSSGFMLDRTDSLEIGASILLQLPGLNLTAARVIWTNDLYAGCEFERPLSSHEMTTLEESAWCM